MIWSNQSSWMTTQVITMSTRAIFFRCRGRCKLATPDKEPSNSKFQKMLITSILWRKLKSKIRCLSSRPSLRLGKRQFWNRIRRWSSHKTSKKCQCRFKSSCQRRSLNSKQIHQGKTCSMRLGTVRKNPSSKKKWCSFLLRAPKGTKVPPMPHHSRSLRTRPSPPSPWALFIQCNRVSSRKYRLKRIRNSLSRSTKSHHTLTRLIINSRNNIMCTR